MSAFAVAAFHDARLPVGAELLEAVVWIRATGIGEVDASLRVWTPQGATLARLRELEPAPGDLLGGGGALAIDARTVQIPAGRWQAGVREYELAVALPACASGDELLAARIGVVVDGEVAGRAQLVVSWCEAHAAAAPAPESAAEIAGADLPTGRSRRPPGTVVVGADGRPCPGCGAPREQDDAFCEGCGRELAGG
jgi:hypothetical protein